MVTGIENGFDETIRCYPLRLSNQVVTPVPNHQKKFLYIASLEKFDMTLEQAFAPKRQQGLRQIVVLVTVQASRQTGRQHERYHGRCVSPS